MGDPMPAFAGVNHFALTVTDLDVSQRFYTDVLDFLAVLDFGYGRVCMHKPTGFTIGLMQHPEGRRAPFSELNTGLDHVGLAAADRDELVGWEGRFRALGVTHTPIQDMPLGHHLNFRDPDGIALEFQAPSAIYAAALAELRSGNLSDAEVLARAAEMVGEEFVARPVPRRP
jgi:glyoxylase I family protein